MDKRSNETPQGFKGLGDRLEYLLRRIGIHQAVKKYVGDCGCENRKEWLNKKFPERMTESQADHFEYLLSQEETKALPYFRLYNEIHGTGKKPKSCGSCNEKVISTLYGLYEKTRM